MFTDRIPDCHSPSHLAILRATPKAPVVGLKAGEPVRVLTHWYKGKTVPCVESSPLGCPICQKGVNKRYYAYYPIRSARGSAAAVELTATAEAQLVDSLRLCPDGHLVLIRTSRAAGKKNNPLHVECEFRPCSPEEFAAFFSKHLDKDLMKRALCRLWNLPEWEPGINEDDFIEVTRRYLELLIEGAV